MEKQISIFDICARKHGGNQQSRDANASIAPFRNQLQTRVFEAIRAAGKVGLTCEEISIALKLRMHSASARCAELKALGKVVLAGFTRPTQSGRNAAVLIVNEIVNEGA